MTAGGRDTRRYLTIVQDERGYLPPGEVESEPPPAPMIHTVVMADDYEQLEARAEQLASQLQEARVALEEIGLMAAQYAEDRTWHASKRAREALSLIAEQPAQHREGERG